MENIVELSNGFQNAYIDATHSSNLAYRPKFISNDINRVKRFLNQSNRS